MSSLDNNECIFCLETDNLVENTICDCNYKYHVKCFIEWIEKSQNCKCIICEKKISPRFFSESSTSSDEKNDEVYIEIGGLNNTEYLEQCKNFLTNIIQNELLINITPGVLKENIDVDFNIRNIPFNLVWNFEDQNLEFTKIGITHIVDKGLIYYKVMNNGQLVTNIELGQINQNRFRHAESNLRPNCKKYTCAIILLLLVVGLLFTAFIGIIIASS